MSLWCRVFGTNDVQPTPAGLVEHLHSLGLDVQPTFRGDDLGWFAAELVFEKDATPILLERFLTEEEGIRSELNTWAAWLETQDHSPNHAPLMQHMIQTRQLFTVRRPIAHSNEILVERLCTAICQHLASVTAGVYQLDGQGFFAADGTLLLQEY